MRRVEVADEAGADIGRALAQSRERFGQNAQRRYDALLRRVQKLLQHDPARAGVSTRDGLPTGYFLLHLRHARTRGVSPKQPRRVILFRYDDERVYILRVLHDSMDIARHASEDKSEA